MTVLIVKHVDLEGPGAIEDCLKQEAISYRTLNLQRKERFPRLDDFHHVVLLGGPMNVDEEDLHPFLREEDLFIKEAIQRGKSVLGICLGAQLIAKALGARVFRAPLKEIGWRDVLLTVEGSEDPLFSLLPKRFSVFHWHGDTFELPSRANLLATSTFVPHQAFRYAENVYALQFHLEVTRAMIRGWITSYEEEFDGHTAPVSREVILEETEKRIAHYHLLASTFFTRFFRQTAPHLE